MAPCDVERGISAHQNQPRRRVARRSILGPISQGAKAGILIGLFRGIHVAEVAQQRGDRLGTGGYERGIDPSRVIHSKLRLARSTATGLNSYAPPGLARANSDAVEIASARSEQSMMKNPSSCSLVSANGPSSTNGGARSLPMVGAPPAGPRLGPRPTLPGLCSPS